MEVVVVGAAILIGVVGLIGLMVYLWNSTDPGPDDGDRWGELD